MKKWISLFLSLTLLFSLTTFTASARETDELALMEHTLSYADLDTVSAAEETTRIAKRETDTAEVSLITAAPLIKDPACLRGEKLPIRSLLFSSGAPKQYYCVAIYKTLDTAFTCEPEAIFADEFPEEAGIYATTLLWDTAEAGELYWYKAIFFTAVVEGEELVPVEGTLSYQSVGMIMQRNPAQWMNFLDVETEEKIETLSLVKGEPDAAIAQVGTSPCTSTGELSVSVSDDCISVTELSGLMLIDPTEYGWSVVQASIDQAAASLRVEVCAVPGGHQEAEPTVIKEPTQTESGVTEHRCEVCGASYTETTYLYPPVYEQFTDVNQNDWFCGAVQFAVSNGLFKGTSENTFSPEETMSRAMLVTVLWRYEGMPQEGENSFTDVPAGTWYTEAVQWAAKNGIVNGVGHGKFDPDGELTREQMAAILYRYAEGRDLDVTARGDLSGFADASTVSDYAKDAMQWAVAEGLISGMKNSGRLVLAPSGSATRAQVATILMRFIENCVNP